MIDAIKYKQFNEVIALIMAVSDYIKKNTAVLDKKDLCDQETIEEVLRRG